MKLSTFPRELVVAAVVLAAGAMFAQAAQDAPVFGGKKKIAFALKGDIYYLEPNTGSLPDFSKLKPVGTIYATELNVPERSFDSGFPGVTDRFEWFAIDYHGTFLIEKPGKYNFRLTSDDGSQLWIDGTKLIDVDGIHPPTSREATVDLAAGTHQIRVPYFQGPRFYVALTLEVAPAGEPYTVFKTSSFAPAKIDVQNGKTKVSMGAAILFDFDKFALKPGAEAVLAEIKSGVLDDHPKGHFVVEGYTDDIGGDAYNQRLSEQRAQTVVTWLRKHGIAPTRLTAKGHGKRDPKVPNTSDENRAQNRRVEITID